MRIQNGLPQFMRENDMTQEDWEQLEEEILELLSDAGISAIVEDAERVTTRYVSAIRRLYKESSEADNDSDD